MKKEKEIVLRFLKCVMKEEKRKYSLKLSMLKKFTKGFNFNNLETENELTESIKKLEEHRIILNNLTWLYWMVDNQDHFLSDDEIYGKL